ncbi:MAG: DUF1476 domain-containing protein [Stellaceae bacterium]
MSDFDEREKGFERKFQHDQEFAFKVKSRRNRIVARWAAGMLGQEGAEAEAYVAAIVTAELQHHGDEQVVAKVVADLAPKGIDRFRIMTEFDNAEKQAQTELGAPK